MRDYRRDIERARCMHAERFEDTFGHKLRPRLPRCFRDDFRENEITQIRVLPFLACLKYKRLRIGTLDQLGIALYAQRGVRRRFTNQSGSMVEQMSERNVVP